MVHQIIDEADVIGLVVEPRCGHVLEAGALPGHKAASAAVVDFIGFNANCGRTTFDVETPILRIVNGIADDMPVLYRYKINAIVVGTADGAPFDVDVLRLIDLQCFVGLALCSTVERCVADKQGGAAFAMKGVTAGRGHDVDAD